MKTKTATEVLAEVVVEAPVNPEDKLRSPSSKEPKLREASPLQRGEDPEAVEAAATRAVAIQHMVSAFKALADAEDSLSKGSQADAIISIVPVLSLPEAIRPKHAKISEIILGAMGRDVRNAQHVKLPDGSVDVRLGKSNAYRQFATRYIDCARWEASMLNKAEVKHRDENCNGKLALPVSINGVAYDSPVAAIRAGNYFTTVHRLFKNALAPSILDLTDVSESKSEALGRDAVKSFSASIRGYDDEGKAKKARVKIAGNQAMTYGAVAGLLMGLKAPLTAKRHEMLLDLLSKLAPKATV